MKACGESDFYRNVFTLLAFTNQTHLMQLTVFGNITVMRFSFLPLQSLAFSLLILPQGGVDASVQGVEVFIQLC